MLGALSHSASGYLGMVSTERIRVLATFSLCRGCAFAGTAIAVFMVGLSAWPADAFKVGALGMSLVAVVLILQGLRAARRDLSHTEVWLMLERERPFIDEVARQRIRAVLRDVNLHFAIYIGWVAVMFWGVFVVLRLIGVPSLAPALGPA